MALGVVNIAGIMKSDIEKLQQNINDLIGQTENTGGTVTTGTVMAKLNSMLNNFENGNGLKIKSLQHGEVADGTLGPYSTSAAEGYRYVTINPVNIDKSILLVEHAERTISTSGTSHGFVKLHNGNTIAQLNYKAHQTTSPWKTTYYYNAFVYYVLEFE